MVIRTTKEQILALLKQHGNLTIMDLANELEITEMAVRRHIQTLDETSSFVQMLKSKQWEDRLRYIS